MTRGDKEVLNLIRNLEVLIQETRLRVRCGREPADKSKRRMEVASKALRDLSVYAAERYVRSDLLTKIEDLQVEAMLTMVLTNPHRQMN